MTRPRTTDVATVVAIGIVAYLIKDVLHEAVGHGGACLLVGGKPIALSSAWWDGTYDGVSEWGRRAERAGGTLANIVLGGGLVLLWHRYAGRWTTNSRYFVWLVLVTNLFSGAGYLMVDPIANFGDWGHFVEGLRPNLPIRIALVSVGVAVSALTLRFAIRTIAEFLPADPRERRRRARLLCVAPYALGSASVALASLRNPAGVQFALTSALANFGGTAFLAWLPAWTSKSPAASADAERVVSRSVPWLVAAVLSLSVLFLVLGPSIRFSPR